MSPVSVTCRSSLLCFVIGRSGVQQPGDAGRAPGSGWCRHTERRHQHATRESIGAIVDFTSSLELTVGRTLDVEVLLLDASDPSDLALAFHPHTDDGEKLRTSVTNTAIVSYNDQGASRLLKKDVASDGRWVD